MQECDCLWIRSVQMQCTTYSIENIHVGLSTVLLSKDANGPLQWQPANLAIVPSVSVLEGAVWANTDVAAITTTWPWGRSALSRDLVEDFRRYVRIHRHMATRRRRWATGRWFGWGRARFDTAYKGIVGREDLRAASRANVMSVSHPSVRTRSSRTFSSSRLGAVAVRMRTRMSFCPHVRLRVVFSSRL